MDRISQNQQRQQEEEGWNTNGVVALLDRERATRMYMGWNINDHRSQLIRIPLTVTGAIESG
jgi:hypothetical protein